VEVETGSSPRQARVQPAAVEAGAPSPPAPAHRNSREGGAPQQQQQQLLMLARQLCQNGPAASNGGIPSTATCGVEGREPTCAGDCAQGGGPEPLQHPQQAPGAERPPCASRSLDPADHSMLQDLCRRLDAAGRKLAWLAACASAHVIGCMTVQQAALFLINTRPYPHLLQPFAEWVAAAVASGQAAELAVDGAPAESAGGDLPHSRLGPAANTADAVPQQVFMPGIGWTEAVAAAAAAAPTPNMRPRRQRTASQRTMPPRHAQQQSRAVRQPQKPAARSGAEGADELQQQREQRLSSAGAQSREGAALNASLEGTQEGRSRSTVFDCVQQMQTQQPYGVCAELVPASAQPPPPQQQQQQQQQLPLMQSQLHLWQQQQLPVVQSQSQTWQQQQQQVLTASWHGAQQPGPVAIQPHGRPSYHPPYPPPQQQQWQGGYLASWQQVASRALQLDTPAVPPGGWLVPGDAPGLPALPGSSLWPDTPPAAAPAGLSAEAKPAGHEVSDDVPDVDCALLEEMLQDIADDIDRELVAGWQHLAPPGSAAPPQAVDVGQGCVAWGPQVTPLWASSSQLQVPSTQPGVTPYPPHQPQQQ
jgi:hypothetical protein